MQIVIDGRVSVNLKLTVNRLDQLDMCYYLNEIIAITY